MAIKIHLKLIKNHLQGRMCLTSEIKTHISRLHRGRLSSHMSASLKLPNYIFIHITDILYTNRFNIALWTSDWI